MAHKFIKTAFKDECVMLKVVIDGREVWAECDKVVKEFAKKNFKEGDDVEFEYENKDKTYKINGNITKVGGTTSAPSEESPSPAPSSLPSSGGSVNESIKRQAIAHATSRTMISMAGHVNPNNVKELFNSIYDVILAKVN